MTTSEHQMVTAEQLARLVDNTIAIGRTDPEVAHSREDELLDYLVKMFCPDWVKVEVERLADADFPRWYA